MIIKSERMMTTNSSHQKKTKRHVFFGNENEDIEILVGQIEQYDQFFDISKKHGHQYSVRHIIISPENKLTGGQLNKTISSYLDEFQAHQHEYILLKHKKKRADQSKSDEHFHLMINETNLLTGRVLDNKKSWLRNEKVARSLEVEFGHNVILGKHNKAVYYGLLADKKPEIASKIEHLLHEELPSTSYSHKQFQTMKRKGVSLPEVKQIVKDCYSKSDSFQSLKNALAEQDIFVQQGKKTLILLDNLGNQLGSLQRILSMKKSEFQQYIDKENKKMEDELRKSLDKELKKMVADFNDDIINKIKEKDANTKKSQAEKYQEEQEAWRKKEDFEIEEDEYLKKKRARIQRENTEEKKRLASLEDEKRKEIKAERAGRQQRIADFKRKNAGSKVSSAEAILMKTTETLMNLAKNLEAQQRLLSISKKDFIIIHSKEMEDSWRNQQRELNELEEIIQQHKTEKPKSIFGKRSSKVKKWQSQYDEMSEDYKKRKEICSDAFSKYNRLKDDAGREWEKTQKENKSNFAENAEKITNIQYALQMINDEDQKYLQHIDSPEKLMQLARSDIKKQNEQQAKELAEKSKLQAQLDSNESKPEPPPAGPKL